MSAEPHLSPAEVASLLAELDADLHAAGRSVVRRLVETMPAAYFDDTDPATRLSHVKAILAVEASGVPQELRLCSDDGRRYTFIHEVSYPGQLARMVRQLPRDRPLRSARVHTATDGRLLLDVFELGETEPAVADDPRLQSSVRQACALTDGGDAQRLAAHLGRCSADYVLTAPPAKLLAHFRLTERVRGGDDAAVRLQPRAELAAAELDLAVGNADARELFEKLARHLGHARIDILRAYLNTFAGDGAPPVALISLLVRAADGEPLDPDDERLLALRVDLERLVWLDEPTLERAYRLTGWSLAEVETLTALTHLAHQLRLRQRDGVSSRERLLAAAEAEHELTRRIVGAFRERFLPGGAEVPEATWSELAGAVNDRVDARAAREGLHAMIAAARGCRRTNVHVPSRYALALEVDPALFAVDPQEPLPQVVTYIRGRDFDGFHVRFRDIARGGLRLVRTRSAERHALELERLYQEAHGLAFAQQLKNKDIPEGGSKGVLLLTPEADAERAGKAFADALLDLVTPDPETARHRVDRGGGGALLYLGPDENVSDSLIDWIVERAGQRGYPLPEAFMSSKPGVGISHKEYGVTSEGVTVFLDVALRHLGIDPRRQPFSVKLTGGPDGDVAGNEIRILHREYGANARVVGIADGSGSAEEPGGLDHQELLRLVEGGLPVALFDRERLGSGGRVVGVDEPGGLRARNTLHARVVADAFIPAGGRPRTIDLENWRAFLTDAGEPSSRLIVEGANLFLTPEARLELSRAGVLIIPDSSANKCGVICSSFEILACTLLDGSELLKIKERFVADVIERLRELARLEALRLFEEQRHRPEVPLPELSARLSRAILRAADAIEAHVGVGSDAFRELAGPLLARHVPRVLLERCGDRLERDLPSSYVQSAVATVLASRIVYREGLAFFEEMSAKAIAELALRYARAELASDALAARVAQSGLPDAERLAEIVREGGPRLALRAES